VFGTSSLTLPEGREFNGLLPRREVWRGVMVQNPHPDPPQRGGDYLVSLPLGGGLEGGSLSSR